MGNFKFKYWKIIIISVLYNLLFLAYFIYLLNNPRGDFFGRSIEFMNFLIYFPILIFITSFWFDRFSQKLLFATLSVLSVYGIIIDDLIITNFNRITLQFFIAYSIFPIISASIAQLCVKLLKRIGVFNKQIN